MDVNMRELVANEISISQPSSSCDSRQEAGKLLAACNSNINKILALPVLLNVCKSAFSGSFGTYGIAVFDFIPPLCLSG